MIRFAVYYVPPAITPFYRLGTSIIGYDIRAEQMRYTDNAIRARLADFDERYLRRSQPHGLHCTVVYPQFCRRGDLPAISQEIERVLNSLNPDTDLQLSLADDPVTFWVDQRIVVLRYDPNPALLMVHALLVSALARYVPSAHQAAQDMDYKQHRRLHYHYDHIFDDYAPHFTLFSPYEGDNHEMLKANLYNIFGGFRQHKLDSLCLLIQPQPDALWTIYREYHRHDEPK